MATRRAIMSIGAHADDIEFNSGATLAKYRERGYEVVYVMSTNNMSGGWSRLDEQGLRVSRNPPYDEIMPQRKLEAQAAARFFGTEAIHLDHPQRHYTRHDGRRQKLVYGAPRPDCAPPDAPSIVTAYEDPQAVQALADLILKHNPEAVLSHGLNTTNIEHIGSALLVTNAYWQCVKSGYQGWLLFWQDITPAPLGQAYQQWDTFIDVSGFWPQKLQSLALHASQIVDTRTLEFPDMGKVCGCEQAEVYIVIGRGSGDDPQALFSAEILRNMKSS